MTRKEKKMPKWLIILLIILIILLLLKRCGHPFGGQSDTNPVETQLTAQPDSLPILQQDEVTELVVNFNSSDDLESSDELKFTTNWENQYETLIAQANKYRENEDYESAKKMYQQAQQLAQANNNKQKTDAAAKGNHAFTHFLQGKEYFNKEDFENAITSFSNVKETGVFPNATIDQLIQRCEEGIIRKQTREKGVLINGVYWATSNVASPGTFADNPEDTGMFYQWNRKRAWAATGSVRWVVESILSATDSIWQKANDPSPAGWRVPTLDEIKKLCDKSKVDGEWTTINGKKGRKLTDKTNGNSIFIPATGYRRADSNGSLIDYGSSGIYWSSAWGSREASNKDFGKANSACVLLIFSENTGWYNGWRGDGFCIRPVAE